MTPVYDLGGFYPPVLTRLDHPQTPTEALHAWLVTQCHIKWGEKNVCVAHRSNQRGIHSFYSGPFVLDFHQIYLDMNIFIQDYIKCFGIVKVYIHIIGEFW